MGWFNSFFNTIKDGVRRFGGTVKSIANSIATGARFFSAIPVIGSFANGVATVASGVSTGVDIANGIVDLGEGIQKGFGLATSNGSPAPPPQQATAPTSTAVVRAPQRIIRRVPVRAY
jgi:phage-related protein